MHYFCFFFLFFFCSCWHTADKNANSILQCIYKWKGNIFNPVGNLANQQINGTLFHVIFRFVFRFFFFFLLLHQATRQASDLSNGYGNGNGCVRIVNKKKKKNWEKKIVLQFYAIFKFHGNTNEISYSYNTTGTPHRNVTTINIGFDFFRLPFLFFYIYCRDLKILKQDKNHEKLPYKCVTNSYFLYKGISIPIKNPKTRCWRFKSHLSVLEMALQCVFKIKKNHKNDMNEWN